MPPKTTVWPLELHTLGKHEVLRHYLDAWLPIMLTSNENILYIDAFAGPGEYQGGEPGSPLIAIKRFITHSRIPNATGSIGFEFIESDHDRYMHLKSVISEFTQLPPNATWEAHPGTFHDTMTKILDELDDQGRELPPSFVMIDPFGVSDTPMSTVQRILQNPKAEVCFTFMYDTVNRFVSASQIKSTLTDLFGTPEWQQGERIKDENDRLAFFVDLYKSGLKKAGATQLLHFVIDKEDRRNYYVIIYATKSIKGSDVMKKAMWKVAPKGDFRFGGGNPSQVSFGEGIVDFKELQRQLVDRFHGKGWIPMGVVVDFVMSDATPFHSGHLIRKTLKPMEKSRFIKVSRPNGGSGFKPPGTKILFSENDANDGLLI